MVYVKIIQDMYNEGRTNLKSVYGETEDFSSKVNVYQESNLNPFFFVSYVCTYKMCTG